MPTGIRPRVNEAREFLEIAKDFKDPKEIIREALSNSWDAGASKAILEFDVIRIPGTRKKKIQVKITDDGEGMSARKGETVGTSQIEDFFNLGDSHKPYGSIGTKGHGTKIYYKSSGITVDTWKNGKHIHAETEVPPWEALKSGIVPTYRYDEKDTIDGKGTRIVVDAFEGKQSEFASTDELIQYILWYTVVGSFCQYFGSPKRMEVELKAINLATSISIPFGFKFPDENTDLSKVSDNYCKIFGPKTVACGETEEGVKVTVDIIGAILGEANRGLVSRTYEMMGLWLCKDFIRVERRNRVIEDVFGGQYYYRSMLILANCQQFDLTANRNDIRTDQEEYDLAIEGIRDFVADVKESQAAIDYFRSKKDEEDARKREEQEKEKVRRREGIEQRLQQRLNEYRGRADLNALGVTGAPLKEPKNEAETALLLQAMITSRHPGIDFRIGDYNTHAGSDLLIEYKRKGIPGIAWAELVVTLENLFAWPHPREGIDKVVCWELGKVGERQRFVDGTEAKLTKRTCGRYHLDVGTDSIEVYVLREIIQESATPQASTS